MVEMEETKSLKVHIAGRSYPLKVKESDAEFIKSIAEEVNEKIHSFQRSYANRDKQDCLSMALLTYAVDLHKAKLQSSNHNLNEKMMELDTLLDELLSK